ncbi:DUF2334 domain-containing protein [Allokutzneria oryzae]|uniref:DUF2334 domain-containing protein n=1 Tax=Allokutzneria oryzae TaxID=1378989 RepID=A0ABV6A139_9PSEU
MPTRLVVSLSGIDRRSLEHCVSLAAELDLRRVPLSLLTTPLPAAEQSTVDWIRFRRSSGDAVVLNGFARGPVLVPTQRRARPLMRKPSLPAHEAGLRLIASVASFEARGLATDCFAVLDETMSLGTMTALRRHSFAVCADANGVHDLKTGVHRRGRVHRIGRRGEFGVAWAARRAELVRITADAADLASPACRLALLDAVDTALRNGASASTYADVTAASPQRASARGPQCSPR